VSTEVAISVFLSRLVASAPVPLHDGKECRIGSSKHDHSLLLRMLSLDLPMIFVRWSGTRGVEVVRLSEGLDVMANERNQQPGEFCRPVIGPMGLADNSDERKREGDAIGSEKRSASVLWDGLPGESCG
jgi:hypothetical protein